MKFINKYPIWKKNLFRVSSIYILLLSLNCTVSVQEKGDSLQDEDSIEILSEVMSESIPYDTTEWVDMMKILPQAVYDIRYATEDNFMNQIIYDCAACLMRKKAGEALVAIHSFLSKEGYGLKFFDCYRPAPYQEKLWAVMPDPRYVAHPEKGSNHSRGQAIDLTIVHLTTNEELDMGTEYDFFGQEAHPGYQNLPKQVLANRQMLSDLMQQFGFTPITSEWWHFDFKGQKYEVSDFLWNCP